MSAERATAGHSGNARLEAAAMAVAVLVLAALVFARSAAFGFVFDERILIVENPTVHDLANISSIMFDKFWPGPVRGVYYRPLVILSYALNYALAGEAPWLYHLTNVLLHAAVSALVFLLCLRLGQGRAGALAAAAMFAAHPVHVESVVWVPGRTDVLAALFLVAAWLCHLEAGRRASGSLGEEQTGRAGLAFTVLSALFFLLALMAKEIALALLPLVVLGDMARRKPIKAAARSYALLVAVAVLFMALRWRALSGPGEPPAPDPIREQGLAMLPLNAPLVMALGFVKSLLPWAWRIDYHYQEAIPSAPTWLKALAAALIAGIAGLAITARKRRPLLALALAGFLVSMLPMSHVLPFPTALAERFLYLPSLFVVLAAVEALSFLMDRGPGGDEHDTGGRAWLFPSLRSALPRRPAAAGLAVLAVLLMAANVQFRMAPFADDLAFWRSAASQAPENPTARNLLGVAYRDRGRTLKAAEQFEKAIAIDPGFTVARINLAETMLRQGEVEAGISLLRELQAEDPNNAGLAHNLGVALAMHGRAEEAREQWELAVSLDPGAYRSRTRLARYFMEEKGDCVRAGHHLEAALSLMPADKGARETAEEFERICR